MPTIEEQRAADEDEVYDRYDDPDCYFCGAFVAEGGPHEPDCPDDTPGEVT